MALTSPRFKNNAQLQRAAENNPPLRRGATGEGVRLVQQGLIDLGFSMPISTARQGSPDGIYGTETSGCIHGFQTKHGLSKDGQTGQNTMAKLDQLLPTAGKPLTPLPKKSGAAHKVRVHFRSINTPNVSEFESLDAAKQVFSQYSIDFQMVTGKSLLLSDEEELKLTIVDGNCEWDQVSDEQRLLHSLGGREGVGPKDILVYFANRLKKNNGSFLGGCASHAPGRPAVMLSRTATKYAMAHEVCHVLLGSKFEPVHVDDKDNLMYKGWLGVLTKTPPILEPKQITAVRASPYCIAN